MGYHSKINDNPEFSSRSKVSVQPWLKQTNKSFLVWTLWEICCEIITDVICYSGFIIAVLNKLWNNWRFWLVLSLAIAKNKLLFFALKLNEFNHFVLIIELPTSKILCMAEHELSKSVVTRYCPGDPLAMFI